MGHLRDLKPEYRELVRRLEANPVSFPEPEDPLAWVGFREILEILCSPEEAALLSRLPTKPSSLERVAERLGVPAAELKPRLDVLCDRGLVLDLVHRETGATKYVLAPPVVGFFEFSMMRAKDSIPKKRMAEALHAYTQGDDTFAREVFGGETVIGRALVHETALDDGPLPDVLDWERASSILSEATAFGVSLCYCRHKAEHLGEACGAAVDICLSLNAAAELTVRRGFARKAERAEAQDLVAKARDQGLVQIADNVRERPMYICNCCGCCCGQLQAINRFGLRGVNPSAYEAAAREDKCVGCSRCARACPIGSITMVPGRIGKKRRNELLPAVDRERCIGCGVCVGACQKDSMHMVRRAEPPRVPKNAIERSVRMALERGHLADLMFDEGAGRGSRFLGAVVKTLCALPPAKRALASETVRSRFVRAALARVKDPSGN